MPARCAVRKIYSVESFYDVFFFFFSLSLSLLLDGEGGSGGRLRLVAAGIDKINTGILLIR